MATGCYGGTIASMARSARLTSCLHLFVAFSFLAHFCRLSLAQSPPTTCGDCTVSLPRLFEYTWSPVSYESSTTIEVTVATLFYLIDPAGSTSTSTKLATSTETQNFTIPTTTNIDTVTISYGFDTAHKTPLVSTALVTYPTPFVDYGNNAGAGYFLWTGGVYTSSSCLSQSYGTGFRPTSHPLYPQPTTAEAPNATDTLGYDYTLVQNYKSDLPAGYNQDAFTSWYSASFSDQGAVVQCTANNTWRRPTPSQTTATSTSTNSSSTNATSVITSTSSVVNAVTTTTCFTGNLTTTFCTTQVVTFTSSEVATLTYAPPAPPKNSPSSLAFTEATGSSALTHTSVALLTATSTSHVSTNFRPPETQEEHTQSSSGRGSERPTEPSSPESDNRPATPHTGGPSNNEPPQSSQEAPSIGEGPESYNTPPANHGPSSTPAGGLGSQICDAVGGCSKPELPTHRGSTTFVVSAPPTTRVTQQPVTTAITASSGQVVTLPTTVLSTYTSDSRTFTSSIRSSFTSTATGGEQWTFTSNQPTTITSPAETHVVQVPTTNVITATSGQVLVLPTTISSTIVSGSRTITTTFVSSYSSTATANEQITWTTNQPSTITGPAGTHIIDVWTSSVVTATSGQVFTFETEVLSTATSGTSTYLTWVPTSTVVTATSNGQLITITTEIQSTQTLAAGTYTTELPGGAQGTGGGTELSTGRASEGARPGILCMILTLTAVLLQSWS